MATNLALDDQLIEEVRKIGEFRTKKEAVTAALEDFIRRSRTKKLVDLFGTVDFDPGYDYKAARRRRTEKVNSWLSKD